MRLGVVALNPAIDAEWRVEDVHWEEKNVVQGQRRWPGGKGVNVARWLKFLGADSTLLIPLGGATGREMSAGLRAQGLRARIVRLVEETRVNVVVTTVRGRQMRFNPQGPRLSRREWSAVLRAAGKLCDGGASLILSGALPRGVPANAYGELIQVARRFGQRAFLDCDGGALVEGVKAKPFLIKPNLHELSRWAGRELRTQAQIIAVTGRMSAQSGGWVLVSLGGQGALLANTSERVLKRVVAPEISVRNTVGAGDAMLAAAAIAVTKGLAPEEWLCAGVSAGSAATQCEAGSFPPRRLLSGFRRRLRVVSP